MLLLCCLARAWEGYREEETNIKESYKTFEVGATHFCHDIYTLEEIVMKALSWGGGAWLRQAKC